MEDRKELAKAILLKMKPELDDESADTEAPDVPGYEVAADEVMAAMKNNDSRAFAKSLKSLLAMIDEVEDD